MKVLHVHCRVRDLPGAVRWFEQVWQVVPVVHNEQMAWLGFGEFACFWTPRLPIACLHLASITGWPNNLRSWRACPLAGRLQCSAISRTGSLPNWKRLLVR